MKKIHKIISGIIVSQILVAVLIYYGLSNEKFCNFLENYSFPENHIPSDALGISVIKN